MTLPDRILELLRDGPLTDRQLVERLEVAQQHVNSTCRRLADRGLLVRERGPDGKLMNRLTDDGHAAAATPAPSSIDPTEGEPWFWEGNVQAAVRDHLIAEGWTVLREADTSTREQGIDLLVERDGRRLAVEVKGYPKTVYQSGPKKGQPKPTNPTLQAAHWFNGGFMKLVRLRNQIPDAELAVAVPDFPRYRSLLRETGWAFERLGFGLYLVDEEGARRVDPEE